MTRNDLGLGPDRLRYALNHREHIMSQKFHVRCDRPKHDESQPRERDLPSYESACMGGWVVHHETGIGACPSCERQRRLDQIAQESNGLGPSH